MPTQQQNLFRVLLICLVVFSPTAVVAETEQEKIQAVILRQDALFWDVYNRCDKEGFAQFFSEDVEFFHDRGGATIGRDNLVEVLKKNLCGNENSHLRREAVAGTVTVFPLQKNGVTYGAVISGEHLFYVNDRGKPEYLDGQANFFHVWLLNDGAWKMSRVVSYNHHRPDGNGAR